MLPIPSRPQRAPRVMIFNQLEEKHLRPLFQVEPHVGAMNTGEDGQVSEDMPSTKKTRKDKQNYLHILMPLLLFSKIIEIKEARHSSTLQAYIYYGCTLIMSKTKAKERKWRKEKAAAEQG
ncbi:uncharacterized protein LOC108859994 isoform X1 [Raphanus sativus]|uniref:Uncharacterized protein LOC108859994 isoform X1 n=1 Tax=Raphanus sativus TaxID=3726 RepID=A0A6J0NXM1_RAPSA|nr:uncharacterized protein LOC108859994 isoform X1 [Raphanus sativus]XP_056866374.1 uncharacterized protein LOC108859994 isoform X1 [Raphanus sativus]